MQGAREEDGGGGGGDKKCLQGNQPEMGAKLSRGVERADKQTD